MLAYAKPAEVKVTGSFLLKTAISFGRLQTIDIVITMPVVKSSEVFCRYTAEASLRSFSRTAITLIIGIYIEKPTTLPALRPA